MSTPATLAFVRRSERDIKIRGLEIIVDNRFVKDLAFDADFEMEVAPGEHWVMVTNSLYSKNIQVILAAGERAQFDVGNYVTGLGGMMFVTIGMGPYRVFIDRAD